MTSEQNPLFEMPFDAEEQFNAMLEDQSLLDSLRQINADTIKQLREMGYELEPTPFLKLRIDLLTEMVIRLLSIDEEQYEIEWETAVMSMLTDAMKEVEDGLGEQLQERDHLKQLVAETLRNLEMGVSESEADKTVHGDGEGLLD
jgi:hypothetical protein